MSIAGSCPVCHGVNSGLSLYSTSDEHGRTYMLMKCRKCGASFLSPRLSTDELDAAYDDEYYGEGDRKFIPRAQFLLDLFRLQRSAFAARYIPIGGRVLDIGCGDGMFLQYLQQRGAFELHGLERPGKAARRAAAAPGISLHLGALECMKFPAGHFDVVTLFHVFEHLPNPRETLRTISRILKARGVCILSMPNIASIQARIFKGYWFHLDPPRHVFLMEPDHFVGVAAAHGLICERRLFFSLEQNPYGAIQSALNALTGRRNILYGALKGRPGAAGMRQKASLIGQYAFLALALPLACAVDLIESALAAGATVLFVLRKA